MQPENLTVAKEWDTTTTSPRRAMVDSLLELARDMSDMNSFSKIDILKLVASKPWSVEWKLLIYAMANQHPYTVKKIAIPEHEEAVLG